MAILESVPGLEACVLVDGNEEIRPMQPGVASEHQATGTVSRYIKAISDKEFIIDVSVDTSFPLDCPALVFHTVIDGKVVRKSNFSSATFPESIRDNRVTRKMTRTIDGAFFATPGDNTSQLLKKFKFHKIATSDSLAGDIQDDANQMKKAGEIVIHFFRAGPPTPTKTGEGTPLGDGLQMAGAEVHEKAMKGEAKSHTTSLGDNVETHSMVYHKLELLDGLDQPLATLKFKYRSQNALKSLLIIPRTPSPEPRTAPRFRDPSPDLDNLNTDDRQSVLDFLRNRNRGRSNQNNPHPKKEEIGNNSRIKAEHRIKTEPREGHLGSNAIVDLTAVATVKSEHRLINHLSDLPVISPKATIKREHSDIEAAGGSQKKQKK